MALPLKLGNDSADRQARDALEERLADLDDLEIRVAELERAIAVSRVRWDELAVDVERAGGSLLASPKDLAEADTALHALGMRVHELETLMAHPARRLAVLSHLAGIGPAVPAPSAPASLRALTRARWTSSTIIAGTQVGLEAIADGFPESTPARFRVLTRGTDRPAATIESAVHSGYVAGLWVPKTPEEYEFVVEVQGHFTRSGPLRVVERLAMG